MLDIVTIVKFGIDAWNRTGGRRVISIRYGDMSDKNAIIALCKYHVLIGKAIMQ